MADKTLNNRQKNIIAILHENKVWIKGKELAKLVGVSDRTIRSDIDIINKHFEDELIESNMRKGYFMNIDKYANISTKVKEDIPQTPEQRYMYILQQLLIHEDGINLTFLQEDIYVSGYSIENDIKRVRNELKKYQTLKLARVKNYIYLKGSEIDKRHLYKELLAKAKVNNEDTTALEKEICFK